MMPKPVRSWTKPMQNDICFSPLTYFNNRCRNTDAGVSFLDANAHYTQSPNIINFNRLYFLKVSAFLN
jgi:hypothetical protein